MPTENVIGKARLLKKLHLKPNWPSVFVNVWDAGSARIVEAAGFAAIATGSAGISFSLGYPDGQCLSASEMIDAVARIVRAVKIPVTADVEAGYGDPARTASLLFEAGAVGMNLEDFEDWLVHLDQQVERIRAVRSATPEMVINARTDVYLAEVGEPESRFERTVERIQAFEAAGADCVFVPGVKDEETIQGLVQAVKIPVNILATEGTPPIARLHELGVGRVSVGSGPMRATMALMRRIAIEIRDEGTYEGFTRDTISYADANALFS
jgi:2-methylisocitrate lyase-like PEP mutase family enzyme